MAAVTLAKRAHRILDVPPDGMILAFQQALAERGIRADAAQQAAALRLQGFYDELVAFKAARRTRLRKLLVHPALPRGVWFWGGVGRGKSFLMDCFFAAVPYARKRRVHFHAFLREVHQRLLAHRHLADPLPSVAAQIARETRLMCFDEFHVSDIADAMLLGRLMQALFDAGVIFCITSNYPPDGLYPDGLHRERLLPAIAMLNERLDVIHVDAGIDYRRQALTGGGLWLTPADAANDAHLADRFVALAGGEGTTRPLALGGRQVAVRRRAPGVVWFDFATLCGAAHGQNDYLDIAHDFHTVLLSKLPCLTAEQASEARRLTWLVDVLYDHRVKLLVSAAGQPEALYTQGTQAGEFARTVSRLIEMQSSDYLALPHRRYETHAPGERPR